MTIGSTADTGILAENRLTYNTGLSQLKRADLLRGVRAEALWHFVRTRPKAGLLLDAAGYQLASERVGLTRLRVDRASADLAECGLLEASATSGGVYVVALEPPAPLEAIEREGEAA